MTYSEEEIQKYLSILQNFKDGLNVYSSVKDKHLPPKIPEKFSCENCGNTQCFYSVGRVFIKDFTSKERHYFQKKCIYKREYHYQNKIEEINTKYDLEMMGNDKYELLLKLQKIDPMLKEINEKWKRKRMINISYVIKRVLGEYDKTKADKIQLNLSEKVLKSYDEWYDEWYYQNKIEEIDKKFNLVMTANEKYELLLMTHELEKINEKCKRMINISYLIKRVLSEYDKTKADKIQLNLSEKLLKFYDELYDELYDGWWEDLYYEWKDEYQKT